MVGGGFSRGYQDEGGEVEEAEADDALELQSGRTTAIGTIHYGVPVDIVKHLSVRSLETFRPLSERWHHFLGLASSSGEGEGEGEGGSKENRAGYKRKKGDIKKMEKRKNDGGESGNKKEGEGEDREGRIIERRKRIRRENRERRKFEDKELRMAIRQALGKSEVEDVRFRSPEQERALHAVLDGQTPLVVVLPTGGGKSLLFMAAACLERGDAGVMVVVVPFRALVGDVLRRLRSSGIDCLEWQHGEVNPAAVVVVSADVAASWGFLSYASLLAGQ
ncbi:hypothetical protein B0J12DRAFT_635351, partial [Macrophomina phaseolina]